MPLVTSYKSGPNRVRHAFPHPITLAAFRYLRASFAEAVRAIREA